VSCVTQEELHVRRVRRRPNRFGRHDAPTRNQSRRRAAVGANRFVDGLPDGFDTDVAKRGGGLGGGRGQRQWSRSPLRSSPTRRLLILDEAHSSLDISRDERCAEGAGTVMADRTAISSPSASATVQVADRVWS